MEKIAGILGGMGPESTIRLMEKVVGKTPAKREQEHIRMLVDNRPQIPDRTDFILGKGPSPVPMLQESAQLLEKWGAEFLAIPCNSAHFFIEEIKAVIKIPALNMLELLNQEILVKIPFGCNIGLLTTSGALKAGIHQEHITNFRLVSPPDQMQDELVMEAIYGKDGIKLAGKNELNQSKLLQAIESIQKEGIQAIIAGCTEVELALEGVNQDLLIFSPLDILADRIVSYALNG
jgi:aspartate racemase